MHPLAVADLQRSGIPPDIAERAGFFDVEDASEIYEDFDTGPAIIIPYYNTDGSIMQFQRDTLDRPFCRVRYLAPKQAGAFAPKKAKRYSQPGKSGTRAYFCPLLDWARIAADTQEPIVITEGEKKAVAGIAAGFPVLALGGVFNFTNGGDELMPELEAVNWRGRDVYICFDSDALTNPNILAAEARLVDELQRKRGARCFLIRLPSDGDDKVGLDDFLLLYGPDAFTGLLKAAPYLGALDAKVVSLNRSVAWIEKDGMVWDLDEADWIQKNNFVNGSRFSAIKHITVGGKQRSEPKEVCVAAKWLTHPHAQRFGQLLFRPGEDRVVQSDQGRPALNLWTGWRSPHPGDVQPFLDLTAFLFKDMPAQHRDLPLKLMAYKAQNPHKKIALALVLLGTQGSGKTMWADILRRAMMPYSQVVNPKAFNGQFQGWMEKSLLVVVNEAKGEDIEMASEELKSLISDERREMNEKFRPARQINTYFQFIITSNRRAVGSFSADDRRMVVVNCPPAREEAFYVDYMVPWMENDGPSHVLDYLLNLDLKGWKPPAHAPHTAEKHLAMVENLTAIQALAEDMKSSNENTIKLWIDQSHAWAEMALLGSNSSLHGAAQATLDGVKQIQIRPWYEPRELAMIFPNLIASLLGAKYDRNTPPGRLSRELREAGVPYLLSRDDTRGFWWKGAWRQYLVVTSFDDWHEPLAQADFERLMGQWPTYDQIRRRGGRVA
jgi:hypothetical protein